MTETEQLTAAGFREVEAHQLQPGMEVAFVTTMFGFHDGTEWQTAWVRRVTAVEDGCTVEVAHSGGYTEADWCEPVWAKDAA